ncbi:MAG: MerR family transcriptional regulator [Gammaproteobacteria bacterium]|nr:MAG: MerR family transcriptional regulator [Gammaproteobacteria bacterium]
MKVNELANKLNITSDTVRFYSRNGFLSPQKNPNNGYKLYNVKDQHRLQFIISARQLGFTVKDIAKILQEADQGHTACDLVRDIVEKKLAETERQFQHTLALRNRLQSVIIDWQNKPNKAPSSDMICHLIEGFSEHLNDNVTPTKTHESLSKHGSINKETGNE